MTTTVLAPTDRTPAAKIGRRTFRKQIIREGVIDYPMPDGTTRKVAFDKAYLDALTGAYRDGAYDDVPFILADEKNAHTMAPERFRGWIKGMERTADGVDAILELSEDAAQLVESTDYRLGVSPRIKPVRHVDGRTFPVAVNHVLGTLDPRMQGPTLGLRPWEPVDLATPDDEVLDLSGATYREDRPMPRTIDLDSLDPEAADALVSFAVMQGIDLSEPDDEPDDEPDTGDEPDDDEGDLEPIPVRVVEDEPDDEPDDEDEPDAISDDDLEALLDQELAAMGLADEPELVGADLSTPDEPVVDEAASLRYQLAARDYAAAGVPPAVIDLAAGVLSLPADATIDLSAPDGSAIDVREVVVGMLDALKGTVDLSREDGHGLDLDGEPGEDPTTAAWLEHIDENIGN